jgi:transposase
MKPIPNEIRELVIAAKGRKEKEKDIAKWYNISRSSIQKICRLQKDTGNILPTPFPGAKPRITDEQLRKLDDYVDHNPDKTLDEIIKELQLPIKKSRLSVILIGMGYNYKKKRSTPKIN